MPTEKRQRQKEGQRARREAALAAARRRQRKRQVITFVVITVVVFGGIFLLTRGGGDKKQNASTTSSSTSSTTSTTATTTKPNTDLSTPVTVPVDKGQTISVDRGPAPTTLLSKDLKVGDGQEAKVGDTIEVNYSGVTYSDGTLFDSSFQRGQTASFPLNEGGLIEGWVKGIPGMKVGGRRQLVIPSAMAYGDNPQGGRPGGALIFVIDLVSIK